MQKGFIIVHEELEKIYALESHFSSIWNPKEESFAVEKNPKIPEKTKLNKQTKNKGRLKKWSWNPMSLSESVEFSPSCLNLNSSSFQLILSPSSKLFPY